jgi:hypothetical protein
MLQNTIIAAAALGAAVAAFSAPANAQVGFEFGPGGARVYQDRPYRPVIERRERRVIVEEDDRDCRVEIRRRVNQFGEVVTRRTRICE